MKRRCLLKLIGQGTLTALVPWQMFKGTHTVLKANHPSKGLLTFGASSGVNSELLHLVFTFGQGRVASIKQLFINGELIGLDQAGQATGKYQGLVIVDYNPLETCRWEGTVIRTGRWVDMAQQTAYPFLRGWVQAYVRIKYDATLFPDGLRSIEFRDAEA